MPQNLKKSPTQMWHLLSKRERWWNKFKKDFKIKIYFWLSGREILNWSRQKRYVFFHSFSGILTHMRIRDFDLSTWSFLIVWLKIWSEKVKYWIGTWKQLVCLFVWSDSERRVVHNLDFSFSFRELPSYWGNWDWPEVRLFFGGLVSRKTPLWLEL